MAQEFDALANAVKMAESRGQRFDPKNPEKLLTSPAGAEGEMQVLPKTQRDPGFGVAPAKDRSPSEIARVGRDYLQAMLNKYGNEHHALVAYNWGPKNADNWLASGAKQEKLPPETQKYIQKVQEYKGKPLSTGQRVQKMTEMDLKDAGPSYKAALAMSFLVDDKDISGKKPEEDIWKEDETTAAAEPAYQSPLAGMELSYQSPFPSAKPVVRMAEGGDPSAEELEAASKPAFVTPKSGLNRQQGPISQALNSGEAYPAMARGVAETPYNVMGAPVDLMTMAMRPFGYKEEKPVMGSDWIKEKMTALGIRPGEEANPTLQGFRTAAEVGSSLVNPATVARKVGPAVEKGAAFVGKETARQMLRGMEGEGPLAAITPQPMYAVPPGPAAAALAALPEVTPENQFVGRLDSFIAGMKNPVRKDQLIAQVSKNFRDYDIGRLETALSDVEGNAKLTPSQIMDKLNETYSPSKFRTTIIEPSEQSRGSFYQGMDNPYYSKDTGVGQPLGVIHMNMSTPPEQEAAYGVAKDTENAFRRLLRASATPEETTLIQDFLNSPRFNALPDAAEVRAKFDTGIAQANKIRSYVDEANEVDNMMRFPILSKAYDPIFEAKMEQYRGKMPWAEAYDKAKFETHVAMLDQANDWLKKNKYKPMDLSMIKQYGPGTDLTSEEDFVQAAKEAMNPVEEMIVKATNNLRDHLKSSVYVVNQELSKDLPYTGQHSSLQGGNNPIAFSRFSTHTTEIPGMGEVKGIYVNELQSDLLDDLRKAGKRGGSREQDLEAVQKISTNIEDLTQKMRDAQATGKGALAEDLDRQIMAAKQRKQILDRRSRIGTYDTPEAIHNMENQPQVAQQLMAKNVIGAAIQRGDQFVAFPGKESAQAQLYEKLPHNLKQVVKDLGPGFEVRPIQLESPMGPLMHTAVVWGPEAAARIKKTGVPFKDGGSVDKANIDHRKYL